MNSILSQSSSEQTADSKVDMEFQEYIIDRAIFNKIIKLEYNSAYATMTYTNHDSITLASNKPVVHGMKLRAQK